MQVDTEALSGQMSAWRNEILGKGSRGGSAKEGSNLNIKGLPDYAIKKLGSLRSDRRQHPRADNPDSTFIYAEDRRSLAKTMKVFRRTQWAWVVSVLGLLSVRTLASNLTTTKSNEKASLSSGSNSENSTKRSRSV